MKKVNKVFINVRTRVAMSGEQARQEIFNMLGHEGVDQFDACLGDIESVARFQSADGALYIDSLIELDEDAPFVIGYLAGRGPVFLDLEVNA